ncbi:PHD finger protein 20-like protein 1 isoform X1 [Branchiostoma lanceolatum]|uniref:PHD finger protein 20-like protein 1 isoform X1 n=1 Tax=Branchiostoma lanceolatum TaxID=7740 RepID=UPI0034515FA9
MAANDEREVYDHMPAPHQSENTGQNIHKSFDQSGPTDESQYHSVDQSGASFQKGSDLHVKTLPVNRHLKPIDEVSADDEEVSLAMSLFDQSKPGSSQPMRDRRTPKVRNVSGSSQHDVSGNRSDSGSGSGTRHKRWMRPGIALKVGAKMEAMDYLKKWYPAKIEEVDYEEREILVHFEGWNHRYDEWLPFDSERIRPTDRLTTRKEGPIKIPAQYKVGDEVLARWTDCKYYPAKILEVRVDASYRVHFYDGIDKTVKGINVRPIPDDMKGQDFAALAQSQNSGPGTGKGRPSSKDRSRSSSSGSRPSSRERPRSREQRHRQSDESSDDSGPTTKKRRASASPKGSFQEKRARLDKLAGKLSALSKARGHTSRADEHIATTRTSMMGTSTIKTKTATGKPTKKPQTTNNSSTESETETGLHGQSVISSLLAAPSPFRTESMSLPATMNPETMTTSILQTSPQMFNPQLPFTMPHPMMPLSSQGPLPLHQTPPATPPIFGQPPFLGPSGQPPFSSAASFGMGQLPPVSVPMGMGLPSGPHSLLPPHTSGMLPHSGLSPPDTPEGHQSALMRMLKASQAQAQGYMPVTTAMGHPYYPLSMPGFMPNPHEGLMSMAPTSQSLHLRSAHGARPRPATRRARQTRNKNRLSSSKTKSSPSVNPMSGQDALAGLLQGPHMSAAGGVSMSTVAMSTGQLQIPHRKRGFGMSQRDRSKKHSREPLVGNAPKDMDVDFDHNKYKCPIAGCGKAFRKEMGLLCHKKHYHEKNKHDKDDLSAGLSGGEGPETQPEKREKVLKRKKERNASGAEGRIKHPSGSRTRTSSDGRPRNPSESRSRHPSESRSRHPSESRSRHPSENRSRHPSENRPRNPNETRGRPPGSKNRETAARLPRTKRASAPPKLQTSVEGQATEGEETNEAVEDVPMEMVPDMEEVEEPEEVAMETGEEAEPEVPPVEEQEFETGGKETLNQDEVVHCLCNYPEEDGFMIQCEVCMCWQHGMCVGLTEETVPKKYVCFACLNPQAGQRLSARYLHDQDWFKQGMMARFSFAKPPKDDTSRYVAATHTLMGDMYSVKTALHSLQRKIQIAKTSDHPELILWSRRWEKEMEEEEDEEEEEGPQEEEQPHTPQDTSMDTEDGQNETVPQEGTNEEKSKESSEADKSVIVNGDANESEANSSVEQIPIDTKTTSNSDNSPKSNDTEKRDQPTLHEKGDETKLEKEKEKSDSPRNEQNSSTTPSVPTFTETKSTSTTGKEAQGKIQPSVSQNSSSAEVEQRNSPAEPQKLKTFPSSEQAKPQVMVVSSNEKKSQEKEKSPVKEDSPSKSSLSDSWGDHSYSRPCTPVERPTVAESRLEDLGVETQTQEDGRLLMAGALAQTADRVESLPTDGPDYTTGVPLEHGLWRQPELTTVEPSTSQSDEVTEGVAMTTSVLTNQDQVAPFSCEVNLLDHICEMQDDVEKRLEMMEQHIIALETACEAPAATREGQDPLHDKSKVKGEIRRLLSDLNKVQLLVGITQ